MASYWTCQSWTCSIPFQPLLALAWSHIGLCRRCEFCDKICRSNHYVHCQHHKSASFMSSSFWHSDGVLTALKTFDTVKFNFSLLRYSQIPVSSLEIFFCHILKQKPVSLYALVVWVVETSVVMTRAQFWSQKVNLCYSQLFATDKLTVSKVDCIFSRTFHVQTKQNHGQQ